MSVFAFLRGAWQKHLRHSPLRTTVVSGLLLSTLAVLAHAAAPAWWAERGVTNPAATPDNYAAANVGQLKHIAARAASEMNDKLAAVGGAGSAINDLVNSWPKVTPENPSPSPDNYTILNQGQLKSVAKLFYSRLAELNYAGPPLDAGSAYPYPWTETHEDDDSYSPVNLGQLKHVFSFDLDYLTIPQSGLRLWLRADSGLPASGAVSVWPDGSRHGAGNNAFQSDPEKQPRVAAAGMNGRPVVRFDGINDALNLPDLMAGAQAGEIYIVSRLENFDNQYNGLCQFGVTNGVAYSEDWDDFIWEDFGIADSAPFPGPGSALLTRPHIYNSSITAEGLSTVRFNGTIIKSRETTQVLFTSTPFLGNDNFSEYYKGDIAEVIVYDHPLTATERDTVHAYLAAKYLDTTPPESPLDLFASEVTPHAFNLRWSASTDNIAVASYDIYRDGVLVGSTPQAVAPSFQLTGLEPATSYSVTVIARDATGNASAASNALEVTTEAMPIAPSGLVLWLRGDSGLPASGLVSTWLDRSGLHHHATQTNPAAQPQVIPSVLNGHPVVRFDGGQGLWLPDLLSHEPEATGEIIAVVRVADKSTGAYEDTNNKLWDFGGSGTGYNKAHAEDTVYSHYNQFGLGGAAQGGDRPAALVSGYHIFSTASDGALWTERYNGVLTQNALDEGVDFTSAPNLGAENFAGDFAEILVYDHVLTPSERSQVNAYLATKYSLSLPDTEAPSAPDISVGSVSTSSFILNWPASTDNVAVTAYDIYRDETLIGSVSGSTLVFAVTGLAPVTTSSVKVTARDAAGNLSPYSNTLKVTTLPSSPGFIDTDGDGMADSWEIAHGLDPSAAADALYDGDGDGICNLTEYLSDSDPWLATTPDSTNSQILRVIWPQ